MCGVSCGGCILHLYACSTLHYNTLQYTTLLAAPHTTQFTAHACSRTGSGETNWSICRTLGMRVCRFVVLRTLILTHPHFCALSPTALHLLHYSTSHSTLYYSTLYYTHCTCSLRWTTVPLFWVPIIVYLTVCASSEVVEGRSLGPARTFFWMVRVRECV
jgi:hypothetical protein